MNDSARPRLFSFDRRRDHEFEDEPVVSCFIGKLFHYTQGRNAWHGIWSQTYPGDSSFSLELQGAKDQIEKNRTQGSQWAIAELPVLVLAANEDALLIGEINSDSPLSEVSIPRTFGPSLEGLAQLFQPHRPNSIFRFIGASSEALPARLPFLRYRSESFGINYKLEWHAANCAVELRPLLSIAARVCRCLQNG